MKLAEAQKLDAEGRLHRKVMTEHGWYVPRNIGRKAVAPVAPAVFRRARPKKSDSEKPVEEPI